MTLWEFDGDRPSITGRKISSNTLPTAPEYAYIRRLPLPALIVVVPVLLIVGFVLLWPRQSNPLNP